MGPLDWGPSVTRPPGQVPSRYLLAAISGGNIAEKKYWEKISHKKFVIFCNFADHFSVECRIVQEIFCSTLSGENLHRMGFDKYAIKRS